MNQELEKSKYAYVVLTKRGGKYYITEDQRKGIYNASLNTNPEFDTLIFTNTGEAFNFRMISDIMTLGRAIEYDNLEKGMYKCAAGAWHAKNDKCDDFVSCFYRQHPEYEKRISELNSRIAEASGKCGRCTCGKVIVYKEDGTIKCVEPCECSMAFVIEKEKLLNQINKHMDSLNSGHKL